MSFKPLTIIGAISVCAVLTFSSCNGMFGKGGKNDSASVVNTDPYKDFFTPKIDSIDYTIKVPNHFYSSSSLNDEASFQYNDSANEEYVVAICESKTDFIKEASDDSLYDDKQTPEKNYRLVVMNHLKESMKAKAEPNIKKTTINGHDAEIVDMIANVAGIPSDIYYKIAFIEGTKNMYYITAWTLASEKDQNGAELDNMINSFDLKK